ncbi:hypothetical protein Y032_0010g1107 [Ancylostoma ceylanicum]|nr:hypothetical protein Y032_0010g1107 [Ancylostoma ceylanicum]
MLLVLLLTTYACTAVASDFENVGAKRTVRRVLENSPVDSPVPEDFEYPEGFMSPHGGDEYYYDNAIDPLSTDVKVMKEKTTIY